MNDIEYIQRLRCTICGSDIKVFACYNIRNPSDIKQLCEDCRDGHGYKGLDTMESGTIIIS